MSGADPTIGPANPGAAPDGQRAELRKAVSRFGFFALAFGSMIGVGWVTSVGSWLEQAGPLGASLAFAAGGGLMLCIGLCYAEATPMIPVAGGEVAYSYAAFGVVHAFLTGWCLAFGYIAISGFEAISIGRVLGYLLPGIDGFPLYAIAGDPVHASHLVLAAGFTGLITLVQYRGVAWAATLQRWMIVAFAVVCLVFIADGLISGDVQNARPFFGKSEAPGGVLAGFLAVLVTVPFWFVGFDTIPQAAEEASVSVRPRQLAFLIIASIAAATLFYVLIVVSVSVVAPWPMIVEADLPAAQAFASAFGSTILVRLVLVAALLGLFTSWNGFFLAGSRVLFALGRGRIISPWFGETHPRHDTPHRAVLATGALTLLAPLMGRNALVPFVNVGSFFIALAFLSVALSLIRLRQRLPDLPRPYRIGKGITVPVLAAAGSILLLVAMIVPGSPAALSWPREILLLGFSAALGFVFWFGARRVRSAVTESERAFHILEHVARALSSQIKGPRDQGTKGQKDQGTTDHRPPTNDQ